MSEISMNKLPAPTWNWLQLNDRRIALPAEARQAVFTTVMLPEEVTIPGGKKNLEWHGITNEELIRGTGLQDIAMSAGEELSEYVKNSGVETAVYRVAAHTKAEKPLKLKYDYSKVEDAASVSSIIIDVGEASELTVICYLTGKDGIGIQDTRIRAAAGAKVHLVQIYEAGAEARVISSIGGRYEEKAGLDLIQVVTGNGDISLGCFADLVGRKSYLNIDNGYLMSGKGTFDINYIARHMGENTESEIRVNGTLRDQASKIFRGTIDFQKGCKGAKGDEREDVLLMDEDVHNNTVPLILCAEEDVEGAHGASIGKISEETLFYFQSRGVPESEIAELMARARIHAVIGRIPDADTREELLGEAG